MVKLPVELLIRSIENPCIAYFKNKNHDRDAPSHFFLIIPNPDCNQFLIVMMTSQIDKLVSRYQKSPKRDGLIASIVHVGCRDFEFLTNPKTSMDCNRAELLTKSELIAVVDPGYEFDIKIRGDNIDFRLVRKTLDAVMGSPVIKNNIKDIIGNWPLAFD